MADEGYLAWVVHRLNWRLQYVERSAAGGATTSDILNLHLPSVFTRTPNTIVCIVLAGTNDIGQGVSTATTISNLATIYATLRGGGVIPVCVSDLPRDTAAYHDNIAALNDWIARHAREHGYLYVDAHRLVVDPATGNWAAGMSSDGTHPTAAAAKIIGQAVADAIEPYLPPWEAPLTSHTGDTSNGHNVPTFASGFTDGDANGLPDASSPRTGLFFQSGSADCSLTFTNRNGSGDRWLNIERTGVVATTEIRSGGTATSGFSVTSGGKVALGIRFKLTGMGAGNSAYLWAAKNDSSTSYYVCPLYNWQTDIDDTVFYAEVDVPSGWTAGRWYIQLAGPAGPTLSIAQITARDLTALGVV